ncbi:MAG: hypothetical protein K9M54_13360 [Kiritimatiellales bacterium]|nr:hypothetical protein [Kiritimatiellales bacterium]
MRKIRGGSLLSPASMGSPNSYELRGNHIVVRLFGIIPLQIIRMEDVHYLRLATRDEVSAGYLILNWMNFLPRRRSMLPVYVLQTKNGRRFFLRLENGAHFRLRQAIGRQSERSAPHRHAA